MTPALICFLNLPFCSCVQRIHLEGVCVPGMHYDLLHLNAAFDAQVLSRVIVVVCMVSSLPLMCQCMTI